MSISIYGIITLVKVEVMCLFKELTGDTNSAMILLAELELKKKQLGVLFVFQRFIVRIEINLCDITM